MSNVIETAQEIATNPNYPISPRSELGRDFLVAAAEKIGYNKRNEIENMPADDIPYGIAAPMAGLPAWLHRVTWRREIFQGYSEGWEQATDDILADLEFS